MHKLCYRPRSWLPAYLQGAFRLEELTLSCVGDHLPAEAQEEYYPGTPENIECLYVYACENGDEKNITGHLSEEQMEEIIEEMLEYSNEN